MKRILIAVTCALFVNTSLPSQTTKPASKSVGLGKPGGASNEDTNIRAYIELLRTDLKQSKSQVLGEVMHLNADQALKFWPLYKEFESEYATLGDQIVSVVKLYADQYDNITDAIADRLANQVIIIEQQRILLKKKYYDRMKEALGATTAARFLQVENQLERIVDLQIAAHLPVISDR